MLTWQRGPQTVGWALGHSGLILPFAGMVLAGVVWIVTFTAFAVARRDSRGWLGLAVAGIYLASVALLAVPYEAWRSVSVPILVRGPHVGDFLTEAAAAGDVDTLGAFVVRGAAVDARGAAGATALHAAAVAGQTRVVEFLLAQGADMNAVDGDGDSPLAAAEFSHRLEVARLLWARGAQWISSGAETR